MAGFGVGDWIVWGLGVALAFKVSNLETFYFMCQLVVKRRYGEFWGVLELEIIRVKVLKNPLMVRVIDSLM